MSEGMVEQVFERVAALNELPDGAPVGVALPRGTSVCLIRKGNEVFACEDCCSHAEYPMSEGELVDDYVIECSLHGAQFDIRTGEALELPATEALRMLEVRIDDGGVFVRSEE